MVTPGKPLRSPSYGIKVALLGQFSKVPGDQEAPLNTNRLINDTCHPRLLSRVTLPGGVCHPRPQAPDPVLRPRSPGRNLSGDQNVAQLRAPLEITLIRASRCSRLSSINPFPPLSWMLRSPFIHIYCAFNTMSLIIFFINNVTCNFVNSEFDLSKENRKKID